MTYLDYQDFINSYQSLPNYFTDRIDQIYNTSLSKLQTPPYYLDTVIDDLWDSIINLCLDCGLCDIQDQSVLVSLKYELISLLVCVTAKLNCQYTAKLSCQNAHFFIFACQPWGADPF